MRALIWDGLRLRFVAHAPEPGLQEGTALVRVRLAGICSTDLQILRGYMGFRGVLGHELVGEVMAGAPALHGRRVVAEINYACRRCADCRAGRERHCATRSVMGILGADGSFADLVRVPVENLHVVPDEVPDRHAVFVEPLAAALRAAEQTAHLAGGRSLVIGAGKLGLLVAQVLAARGDAVAVVTRNARARRAVEALGLAPLESAPAPAARSHDLVVEASGSADGLADAVQRVRPLGAIVLKTTVASRHEIDLAPLVINEIAMIGSRCGSFPPALDALTRGSVRVDPLIEAEFPLERGVEAIERAGAAGALKVLLRPG